jgi:hypothetical protein
LGYIVKRAEKEIIWSFSGIVIMSAPPSYLTLIPYVNGLDLLKRALFSIQYMWPRTLVVDNSEGEPLVLEGLPIAIHRPEVPLGFSQTQNLFQQFAFKAGADVFFFMHSDAQALEGTPEKLLDYVAKLTGKWGVVFTNYDALCCFNTAAVRDTGPWDWRGLPWYMADCDYYRRLACRGYRVVDSSLPVHHVQSQTRVADRLMEVIVTLEMEMAKQYYLIKWGGPRDQEKFREPFDAKDGAQIEREFVKALGISA